MSSLPARPAESLAVPAGAPMAALTASMPTPADGVALRARPVAAAVGARVLASIHDVTPAHWGAVRALWATYRALGVTPALLVVPDWHGAWPLERDRAFVDWLHRRADDGADVLLHGLRHDEQGAWRTWRDDVRAFGRTAGEGEFLTLPRPAVAVRVRDGLARLRALGLDPVGFVPPAWLMRPHALPAIAAEGLRLTEDAGRIYLLGPARPMLGPRVRGVRSPAWRWSGRSAARAWASAAVAAARLATERAVVTPSSGRIMRVALHPDDLAHPATRWSIDRTLAAIAAGARWTRYRDLLRSCDVIGGVDAE